MLQQLLRRKRVPPPDATTELHRALTVTDLTALGLGASIGSGVYTLVGVIIHQTAGPAAIISFVLSGFASALSAVCYSEFASRVPRAGSAYMYSYVTVGEGVAWFTGWQLILEYAIGSAACAKGLTDYVDVLADKRLTRAMEGMPDVFTAAVLLLVTYLNVRGIRQSSYVNTFFTSINAFVILFTIVLGSYYATAANLTTNFAPYGVNGIFQGASISFFCYVGFDVIASAAEEAENPQRDLPRAIVACLTLCTVVYCAACLVMSMMQPYTAIDVAAPVAGAFASHNVTWAKIVISVGAVCGTFSTVMMMALPLPRITYAIASDGLLPSPLGRIHTQYRTPANAAWTMGTLSAFLSLFFSYVTLASMLSAGTVCAYTSVSISVLVLRYREHDDTSCRHAVRAVALYFVSTTAVSMGLMRAADVGAWTAGPGICVVLGVLGCVVSTATLHALPQRIPTDLTFVAPYVPYLPLVSVSCNAHLLVHMPWLTWVRVGVWCGVGAAIYIMYGADHSVVGREGKKDTVVYCWIFQFHHL